MEDVMSHVSSETWVILDVDNTLIESNLQIGSAQWRTYIRNKALASGYSAIESELILDKFWYFAQFFVPVRLVDSTAPFVIERLQQSNTVVIALTAGEPGELEHTQKQFGSVGLSLQNSTFPQRVDLPTSRPGLYDHGVIYCGENSKGEALRAFFQSIGRTPEKVIFVDDKRNQVEELEKTLEKMGIECIGLRFGRADERVKAFDPDVADLQFSVLPEIISDETAKEILSESSK